MRATAAQTDRRVELVDRLAEARVMTDDLFSNRAHGRALRAAHACAAPHRLLHRPPRSLRLELDRGPGAAPWSRLSDV